MKHYMKLDNPSFFKMDVLVLFCFLYVFFVTNDVLYLHTVKPVLSLQVLFLLEITPLVLSMSTTHNWYSLLSTCSNCKSDLLVF